MVVWWSSAAMMPGTLSYKRDLPPAHYSLKVDSYTLLYYELGTEKYDTGVFEAGGHKWRLCFYPNGDIENNGKYHISLYLAIVETDTYICDWEVNVNFKMFIYNQIEDKYLTIQDADGGVKRFHELKKQWGYVRLLSLETFKDSSNGYLFNDSCVFGVEIFVIKCTGNLESLTLLKYPANGTFTWKILDFSKLDKYKPHCSDVFNVGGVNWKLKVYPKGCGREKDKSLSLFLVLAGYGDCSTKEAVFAKFILRLLSRVPGKTYVKSGILKKYLKEGDENGYPGFLELSNLHDASNRFVVNDSLNVQVELLTVTTTKISSMRKRKQIKIDID